MVSRGIILAGGAGSRLYPLTDAVSKQLLPIYDKPMIYYPLSTLMLAGIRNILVISTAIAADSYQLLLGDGSQWGLDIRYETQPRPDGLPEAFKVGENFIRKEPVCMVLGDNILFGSGLRDILRNADSGSYYTGDVLGASIFGYRVENPRRYGVIEFGGPLELPTTRQDLVRSLEEKPDYPKSNWAMIGLYFFDGSVVEKAKSLRVSTRGETEITDLCKLYHLETKLDAIKLGRGIAWLDTGTFDSLLQASSFVQTIQERQGMLIASPEEIAFREGYITMMELDHWLYQMPKTAYRSSVQVMFNEVVKGN